MSFIYKITNNVNNKVYIGKTAFSIEETHLKKDKKNVHYMLQ